MLTRKSHDHIPMTDSAELKRREKGNLVLLGINLLLAVLCFHFYGNRSSVVQEGRSIFRWVAQQWVIAGSDFSHGWTMPLLSLGILWWRRKRIAKCVRSVDVRGLFVIIISLLVHWAAYRAQQPRISLAALVGVLWGIPLYLAGPQVARQLAFPAAYLLLCFTSSLLFYVTFQLRLISTIMATHLLNGLSIETVRQGTAILILGDAPFQLDVADPCSGLRSLFVITALAAPYAYFTMRTRMGKIILFLLSVPLAMLANTIRIVTLASVSKAAGVELAMKLYHDFSGYLVFTIAVLLLTATGAALNRIDCLNRQPQGGDTS